MSGILQGVSFSTRFLRTAGVSLFMVGLLVVSPAVSHAVPINHGTFPADTVIYVDVTEDSSTGSVPPALFGPPNISGDSMDFDPAGFAANSSGGGAPQILDGQLLFHIVAKPGKLIENISFSEAGDTGLARGFDPADDAFTSVTSFIFIEILEVDYEEISQINADATMVFTPSDGDYQLSIDAPGGLTFNSGWTGSAFIDLGPILADNGITGKATRVSVNLDNTLTAISSTGSSAFIGKKDFDGVVITTNVPEPATGLLAALGLLALVGASRRNR